MTRSTQGVLTALLGAMILGLATSAHYLDFVRSWTRIPLLISAVALIASSAGIALRRSAPAPADPDPSAAAGPPRLAWMLLVPVLVVFVAHPTELGAYVAERQAGQLPPRAPIHHPVVTTGVPTPLGIFQFVETATYDEGSFLRAGPTALTGFVSYDKQGHWYVTRLSITCCAADAVSSRVQVVGAPAPARNTWITVVGSWVDPNQPVPRKAKPQIHARSVRTIPQPKDPYDES